VSERPPYTESELVGMVRSIDVRAPERLHERIESMVAERTGPRGRGRGARRLSLVGAPAVCALVLALVLVLSSGGGSTLTLSKTVALTLRPATMSAPAQSPGDGSMLAVAVDGIAFPYWEGSFGFRATGERVDRLDGRTVTTVFYADTDKRWIGYAIVAGAPAPHVSGGVLRSRAGTQYRVSTEDGAQVVTWLRDGRLCVVAGHGVSPGTLLALASWRTSAIAS